MSNNQYAQNHHISNDPHQQDEQQLQLQMQRLELARKKQEEAEEARQYNRKHLKKIKKVREDYSLLNEVRRILKEIYEFTGRAIDIGGHIFPPLRAAISGFGAILDVVETIFLRKETLNRKMIRLTNSIVATGAGIASFVLSCNPATAPIGALLFAVSSAVATVKEGIFWYKENRDLQKAKYEFEKIKHDNQHDEYQVGHAKAKVEHFQQRSNSAKKKCLYSVFSCVAASVATVAAFALVGALTIHPFGLLALGITALAIVSAMTVVSLKERFFPKSTDVSKSHDAHSGSKKSLLKQHKHTNELTDEDMEKERSSITRKPVHEATETIAHALAPKSKEAEVKLLQADIETYRNLTDDGVKSEKYIASQETIKFQQNIGKDQSDDNADDHSEAEHPHFR